MENGKIFNSFQSSSSSTQYIKDELGFDVQQSSKLLQQQKHVCVECGKSYATSSNLSRHKQTHRPLDSPHARKCTFCDRIYVSMPALRFIFT